jgi:hypothetical protein
MQVNCIFQLSLIKANVLKIIFYLKILLFMFASNLTEREKLSGLLFVIKNVTTYSRFLYFSTVGFNWENSNAAAIQPLLKEMYHVYSSALLIST